MANGKKSAKKKKTADQAAQTKREVWGVIVIALGLFLGASMYFDAVGILGKAADGVAAHCGCCAIQVIYDHAEIRPVRRVKQAHAFRADAEVAFAQAHGKAGGVVDTLPAAVEAKVIVPACLHFGKTEPFAVPAAVV